MPDVKPFDPLFRGNQLWFSPDAPPGTLMYLINGKTTTVQLPPDFMYGGGILLASNPDGGMWASAGYLGVDPQFFLHLTVKNQMSFYSLEGEGASSGAGGVDGSLWYTGDGSSISKISLNGVVTHFQIRLPSSSYGYPSAQIVRTPDGSFWGSGAQMTHITQQGKWSTFPLPDGRVWILAVNPFATAHIVIMDEKGKSQSYDCSERFLSLSSLYLALGYHWNVLQQ